MKRENVVSTSAPFRFLRQKGLSLIELMIAITISLIIMLALSAAFLNFTRTNREMAKSNRMIENGRMAIQFLENDIMHAGFWGSYIPQFSNLVATGAPNDVPDALPDPCLTYANWTPAYKTNLLGIPLQTSAAAPGTCAGIVANQKTGTDVLLVRHAEPCMPGEGNCEAGKTGRVYFQSAQAASEISASGAIAYVLDTTGHTLHQRDGTAIADKRQFISNLYYIRNYANTPGDGIPTLVRSSFDLSDGTLGHQPAVPIVEGIEGFKIYLGIDTLGKTGAPVNYAEAVTWADASTKTTPTNRGDGTPDGDFIDCSIVTCTPTQLANVVAVKIFLLARNLEPTPDHTDTKTYQLGDSTVGPFNDHYKRHLYATTVRLINISARRESP